MLLEIIEEEDDTRIGIIEPVPFQRNLLVIPVSNALVGIYEVKLPTVEEVMASGSNGSPSLFEIKWLITSTELDVSEVTVVLV